MREWSEGGGRRGRMREREVRGSEGVDEGVGVK